MSFWNRLEDALNEKQITPTELSRILGITPSVVNAWKIRKSIPRADVAVQVAKQLNTTVEYLIEGTETEVIDRKTKHSFLVPILNQELSAGYGDILPENDFIQSLVELPYFLREYGNNLAGLYVHGDSMQPTLNNGDLVICTSLGWDKEEGLYAIRLNGNGYVKRIQVGTGKIIIHSDNPKYKPIEEPLESENFSIIGKVVLIIKKNI
jgi:phage repressor protein C with HTH and peptisase S24 domain